MIKPSLIAILVVLATLAVLTACSDPAPTPETAETPTPGTATATSPPPANTPATAATTATPTTTPTPTTVPTEVISPSPAQDENALLASLSEAELACIGGDPERAVAVITGGSPASREEQARLIGCLGDSTVGRLFIATIIPVQISEETSGCVLAALEVINPRAVMTAGLEGDAQTAMGGSMAMFSVAVACLDEEEWEEAAPRLGMEAEEREGMVCVMSALGGPAEMATAMTEVMEAEEVGEDTALFTAGLECGIEEGPEPAATPAPATESPAPTPTAAVEAARETATPGTTPTATPATPTLTPTPEPTPAPPE